jgi:hypothetical protein
MDEHEQVESPTWDTKVRCACGERFSSRMEFYLHRGDAYLAQLLGVK